MSRLDDTIEALLEAQEAFSQRMQAQVSSEAEYKKVRAHKMLESKANPSLKSVADREAWVQTQVEEQFLAYLVDCARVDVAKQRINVLRSVLNGLQTLSAEQRSMGETI